MPDRLLAATGSPDPALAVPVRGYAEDGGQGYSGFGHPTETQDIYRELGLSHVAGASPALVTPDNPPLDNPIPMSVAGKRSKQLWEWREVTLTAAPFSYTFIASSLPEWWQVTCDATASLRIAVYLAQNSNAGVFPFRLGAGGSLSVPATDRYLTIVNLGATVGFVSVKAIAGWGALGIAHTFGS